MNKLFGATLLIAGTTIGVGLLAFPTLTVYGGFFPSVVLFFLTWMLMLSTSFFFLDVNLSIKEDCNLITMAEKTLGSYGKALCWVIYLFLLYALTAAYITGCAPLIVECFTYFHMPIPTWLAFVICPAVFGLFIYIGTKGVDFANRLLMTGLIISYILLVFFLPSQVEGSRLAHIDFPAISLAIPVVVTAFGYHIIIPSLVTYTHRNYAILKRAILLGSSIAIIVYLLWQSLVLGSVPLPMLSKAYAEGVSATQPLTQVIQQPIIRLAARFFSFFAIITSFIGVTLSLSDFLTDGFKLKKSPPGKIIALLLTFLPPLFFVFLYPKGFYLALQYAGAFVAILLIFLPAAMAWKIKKYQTPFRRACLCVVMLLALAIVVFDILEQSGMLKPLLQKYLS